MAWTPDHSSNIPLYAQFAAYLRRQIKSGNYKNGAKFPGRDKMAAMWGISRNTVVEAYNMLMTEGLVVARPKSGVYVSYTHEKGSVNWQLYTAKARHKTSTEEYRYWGNADGLTNFSIGSDFDIHPYLKSASEKIINKLSNMSKLGFSKYGMPSLRESLCDHLKTLGISAKPENILITSETIQRLYHVYEALMGQRSNFLYEKANIILTISNIHSLGMNWMPLKIDGSGVVVSDLREKAAKNIGNTILHLDPTDQAPTGIVMSQKRRQEIIKVIQEFSLPVVEIDHSANIWHDRASLNPLKSLDTAGNIIYMGSFMKYYPFDFQVSWIVADPYIIEYLSNVFLQSGVRAQYYMQLLVDELIRGDIMPILQADTKKFIMERREETLALCEKYLKSRCEWQEKNCYFHFWLNFPDMTINTYAENKAIFDNIYPGYFFDRKDKTHVLLCPACIKRDDIKKTIKSLSQIN